jgi:hypothetical protein
MFKFAKTTLSEVTSTVIPLSCETSKVMVTVGVVASPSVATGVGMVKTTSPSNKKKNIDEKYQSSREIKYMIDIIIACGMKKKTFT